jgi:beta-phosphoglucomutase
MSKPNPDIFLYAASEMQSNPIECLVIEDSPHGIEAAKRANMKTIALATTHEKKKLEHADFIFETYKDIDTSLIKSF